VLMFTRMKDGTMSSFYLLSEVAIINWEEPRLYYMSELRASLMPLENRLTLFNFFTAGYSTRPGSIDTIQLGATDFCAKFAF
jgi:hypothetical protein